ncbi:hypothetical protein MF406_04015 [Georgenia sp. TF02-10]|uniref:hypothetical protein n=1 Tax=Georgenia sp. TF02-10 TaxID=2917725 RepID=UPI001FA7C8BE|nr:hypothetical protein [Georgenia sp. TF02-10]UNX55441.1 hypothetical protein MF406_04015 [Georgenia sp. TF02-10]
MHYPWMRYVVPEADFTHRLRQLQLLYLGHAHEHGVVGVTEHLAGVVALLPPDAPEPAPEVVEQIVALHGDRIH